MRGAPFRKERGHTAHGARGAQALTHGLQSLQPESSPCTHWCGLTLKSGTVAPDLEVYGILPSPRSLTCRDWNVREKMPSTTQ